MASLFAIILLDNPGGKLNFFCEILTLEGPKRVLGAVWKAMKALDLRPILKQIRLQERDLASGNF